MGKNAGRLDFLTDQVPILSISFTFPVPISHAPDNKQVFHPFIDIILLFISEIFLFSTCYSVERITLKRNRDPQIISEQTTQGTKSSLRSDIFIIRKRSLRNRSNHSNNHIRTILEIATRRPPIQRPLETNHKLSQYSDIYVASACRFEFYGRTKKERAVKRGSVYDLLLPGGTLPALSVDIPELWKLTTSKRVNLDSLSLSLSPLGRFRSSERKETPV